MTWRYEPNPDRKHKRGWRETAPGFMEVEGQLVGKCPTSISSEIAQELINDERRIEYFPVRWTATYPERIYVIFDGHLYRATPTRPGHSYHGFPENRVRAQELPRTLKQRIIARARELGCEPEVAKWLKNK